MQMLFVNRFGVVCAFVTNKYLQTGANGLPEDIRTSLRDTDLYLNNTKKVSHSSSLSGSCKSSRAREEWRGHGS